MTSTRRCGSSILLLRRGTSTFWTVDDVAPDLSAIRSFVVVVLACWSLAGPFVALTDVFVVCSGGRAHGQRLSCLVTRYVILRRIGSDTGQQGQARPRPGPGPFRFIVLPSADRDQSKDECKLQNE